MRPALLRAPAWVSGLLLVCAGAALADLPARVARLGYTSGAVGLSPAGQTDRDAVRTSRPLSAGDGLWAAPGARAETRIGSAQLGLDGTNADSALQRMSWR